jgi:hypothetical protein
MPHVMVDRMLIHHVISIVVVVIWIWLNKRKPHRSEIWLKETCVKQIHRFIIIGQICEHLVLGRLLDNHRAVDVKQPTYGLMCVASFSKLHLDHMSIVEMTMWGEMDDEDRNMDAQTIILLHQKRNFHLSRKTNSIGFMLGPFYRCLRVFSESRVKCFSSEEFIPYFIRGHLNRAYVVNAVSSSISVRIVDHLASLSSAVSYLVALVPFIGDAAIFIHTIFITVSGVVHGVQVLGHCIVRKCVVSEVEALLYGFLMKKHFNFFWNRKNRALASNFFWNRKIVH